MAVECNMARARKWWLIYAMACLGFGVYCYYDGYVSDKYKDDTSTLLFNQIGAPVLGVAAVAWVIGYVRAKRTRVLGDEKGINVNGRQIAWSDMERVDDKNYERGWVILHYQAGGGKKKYRIDDHVIDHFEELLDEISDHRPDLLPPVEEERADADEGSPTDQQGS